MAMLQSFLLLLVVVVLAVVATHERETEPLLSPLEVEWTSVPHVTAQPSPRSSVHFYKGRMVSVGGCLDQLCRRFSREIIQFDPLTNQQVDSFNVSANVLPSGIAGLYSSVLIGSQVYLLPMCSELGTHDGNLSVILSVDLETKEVGVSPIDLAVVRFGASCVNVKSRIYLVGGTDKSTGRPTSLVSRYDVLTTGFSEQWAELPFPAQSPAVAANSNSFFVWNNTCHSTDRCALYQYLPADRCTLRFPVITPSPLPTTNFSIIAFLNTVLLLSSSSPSFAILDMEIPGGRWAVESFSGVSSSLSEQLQREGMWWALPFERDSSMALSLYKLGQQTLQNSSLLVGATNIVAPQYDGPTTLVADQKAFVTLTGSNSSSCQGEASCMLALASDPLCQYVDTGNKTARLWWGKPVSFLPLTAQELYVCYSPWQPKDFCTSFDGMFHYAIPRSYSPLNLLAPLQVESSSPQGYPFRTRFIILVSLGAVTPVAICGACYAVVRARRAKKERKKRGRRNVSARMAHQEERYKLISKIGEGAFSAVYLVIRRQDRKRFAMKHMDCQSDAERQDAIKECEIMRSLQGHPNVISLVDMFMNFEFDDTDVQSLAAIVRADASMPLLGSTAKEYGSNSHPRAALKKRSRHLCLVMEYHPSGDLKKWLSQYAGHPTEAILCSVAFQVVSVLVHIHKQDPPVIHRDLKPENILINSNAPPSLTYLPVVVSDFGLARLQETDRVKQGAGTLPYVAPECFLKSYSTQCDMWSLGCVLYALATKRITHSTVRLMFEDCRLPNFSETIRTDLAHLGYSAAFIEFVLQLLVPEPSQRLSATQAFKLFRHRDDLIYLSSRLSQQPAPSSAPIARATKLLPPEPQGSLPPTDTLRALTAQPVPWLPKERDGADTDDIQ